MIDHTDNPFDNAAAAAALDIEPTVESRTIGANDDETENTSTEENVSTPAKRPRGRPRGRSRGGRSSRRTRNSSGAGRASVPAAGDTNGNGGNQRTQTVPKVEAPALPPLEPEKLIPLLRQLDKTFTRLIGTAPLDEQELKDGAEACAPVLDHYAPLFLSQPWAPAAIWAGMVYVPRVVEVYDRRKAGGGRKPVTFPASTNGVAAESAAPETVVG
jgi:hypothetical protein